MNRQTTIHRCIEPYNDFVLNDTIASMRLINRMNTIDVAQFDRGLLVAVGPTHNNYACYAPVINTSVDLTITV